MTTSQRQDTPAASEGAPPKGVLVGAWLWVLVPFTYGVIELVQKLQKLFS